MKPDVQAVERSEAAALAAEYGLELVERIENAWLDAALVARFPCEWARERVILPCRRDDRVCVLVADPADVGAQEHVARLLGCDVLAVVAPRSAVLKAIDICYYQKQDSAADLLRGMTPGAEAEGRGGGADDLLAEAGGAPITQLVNLVLLEAVRERASDIHIEPGAEAVGVRYRIDGLLYDRTPIPKHLEQALVSRVKVMARMDIAEKRLPQDGVARARVGEREIDIRVSTVPVADGERVVLRLLDRESSLIPLTDLGMSGDVRGLLEAVLGEPHGLVLCAGPTGSGKTTTLYAALRALDTARCNVMTIEDPIEYRVPGISQMQVKPKIGLGFSAGLRHILRQDPDVILVGETRDLETAEIAVRASLTGHMVFTTVHTNDAPSAVIRMLDVGVEPYLLAAALRAALAQRLVRTLCGACAEAQPAAAADIAALGPDGRRLEGLAVHTPCGCALCREGYRGRTGIYELMLVGPALSEAVRTGGGDLARLRELAIGDGMRTLRQDGVEKIVRGVTSVQEVLRSLGHGASPGRPPEAGTRGGR